MRLAIATFGVLLLAACDFGAREQAQLRQELAAKDILLANLEREVARLTAELASEREQRMRDAVMPAPIFEEAADPKPPIDLTFPEQSALDAGGIVCAANRCSVPRKTFEALLGDTNQLVRQVRVLPFVEDGQPRGFKLSGIRAGGVVHTIGLENGDRVTEIGGHVLGGIDEALAAYTDLKRQREWTIKGVRKGAPFALTIAIVD